MHIISASRKTDIPTFYMDWFMHRVKEGKAFVYNAYRRESNAVSLCPEQVGAIVFWSKNYAPALAHLVTLKSLGYRMFFHYTITGQLRDAEKYVAAKEKNIETFQKLASMFQPEQMHWRFDPIFYTQRMNKNFYLEKFQETAERLKGYTTRCSISFATIYPKVKKNLEREHFEKPIEVPLPEKLDLIQSMVEISKKIGIQLFSCCHDELTVVEGVEKGSCIDAGYLAELFHLSQTFNRRPTREACGCYQSYDIGFYNTCPHGCVYCYANTSHQAALNNFKAHVKAQPMIKMPSQVTWNEEKQDINEQLSLF